MEEQPAPSPINTPSLTEDEVLVRKSIRLNRIKIGADIVLIIVILLIGFYIYANIESFKAVGQDSCRLCEQKTGGTCSRNNFPITCPSPKVVADNFNLSGLLL